MLSSASTEAPQFEIVRQNACDPLTLTVLGLWTTEISTHKITFGATCIGTSLRCLKARIERTQPRCDRTQNGREAMLSRRQSLKLGAMSFCAPFIATRAFGAPITLR